MAPGSNPGGFFIVRDAYVWYSSGMNRLFTICCALVILVGACSSSPEPSMNTVSSERSDEYAPVDLPSGGIALPSRPALAVKEFVADVEPYDIGVIALSTTNALGIGMTQNTGSLQFAPRINTLIVKINQSGNKMEFYLDAKDRILLMATLHQYLDEFSARKLDRDRDMDAAYGSFSSRVEWGTFTKNAIAEPKTRIGYIFMQGSPYFTLTFDEAENQIYLKDTGSRIQRSAFMRWYFTRTQAQAFGDFMDQAYLESTVEGKAVPKADRNPDTY